METRKIQWRGEPCRRNATLRDLYMKRLRSWKGVPELKSTGQFMSSYVESVSEITVLVRHLANHSLRVSYCPLIVRQIFIQSSRDMAVRTWRRSGILVVQCLVWSGIFTTDTKHTYYTDPIPCASYIRWLLDPVNCTFDICFASLAWEQICDGNCGTVGHLP